MKRLFLILAIAMLTILWNLFLFPPKAFPVNLTMNLASVFTPGPLASLIGTPLNGQFLVVDLVWPSIHVGPGSLFSQLNLFTDITAPDDQVLDVSAGSGFLIDGSGQPIPGPLYNVVSSNNGFSAQFHAVVPLGGWNLSGEHVEIGLPNAPGHQITRTWFALVPEPDTLSLLIGGGIMLMIWMRIYGQ